MEPVTYSRMRNYFLSDPDPARMFLNLQLAPWSVCLHRSCTGTGIPLKSFANNCFSYLQIKHILLARENAASKTCKDDKKIHKIFAGKLGKYLAQQSARI